MKKYIWISAALLVALVCLTVLYVFESINLNKRNDEIKALEISIQELKEKNIRKILEIKKNQEYKLRATINNYDNLLLDHKNIIESIQVNYNSAQGKYTILEEDISERRIVAESQLIEIAIRDIDFLTQHFDFYRKTFKDLLFQISWLETNIAPHVRKYGTHIKVSAQAVAFLPIPSISIVTDSVKELVNISAALSEYTALVNDMKRNMEIIEIAYVLIQKDKNREEIINFSDFIKLKFKMQLHEISNMFDLLEEILDSTIKTLKKIKGINSIITKFSKDLFSKVAFWKSKEKEEKNSLDENAIDSLIVSVEEKADELREQSTICNEMIRTDLELIANISSCLNIVENFIPADKTLTSFYIFDAIATGGSNFNPMTLFTIPLLRTVSLTNENTLFLPLATY